MLIMKLKRLTVWPLTSVVLQEIEVGANPVQVEVGEFDEAIEIVEDAVEDVAAESKCTKTHKKN